MGFRRREVIFSTGDIGDWIYFVESGSAKLTLTSPHGKEAVIDILHKGDFFGETALTPNARRRPSNAIALTDLHTTRISSDSLLRLLHSQPAACSAFISGLVHSMMRLKAKMACQLLYDSEQRLANALLTIAQAGDTEQFRRIPKMSQQDLANMIGVTRQRVNVLLKRFRQLGLVDYAGGLRVHTSLRSAAWED